MAALRYRYQTLEFSHHDIHLRTLRDNQQFNDDSGQAQALGISSASWPLFGIVWPSGQVLAHHMVVQPLKGKRILEVGCGIGLSSLLLNAMDLDITATDYHPEAEAFLDVNSMLNNDTTIPFVRTGWGDKETSLGKFDVIIGSDLLYEVEHIELLSDFINQHAHPECQVIVVDPGRGNHAKFSKKMVALGYSHTQHKPAQCDFLSAPFKGQILNYQR